MNSLEKAVNQPIWEAHNLTSRYCNTKNCEREHRLQSCSILILHLSAEMSDMDLLLMESWICIQAEVQNFKLALHKLLWKTWS